MTADHTDPPEIEAAWSAHHRRVLDVAYRMLGSVAEAEDVVAETYARLLASDLDRIEDPRGWLITVAGRLCLDRLRSAERRRRAYVGPWLPEPIVTVADGAAADPADRVTLDDSVRMALLVVLEQLSPAERTTFVLADVFGMPFDDIAELVGRSPAACRQLAVRARRRIAADGPPRVPVDPGEQRRVAASFARACASGDLESLLDVLDPDVVGDFDSGGAVVGAPLDAAHGAGEVASLLAGVFVGGWATFDVALVNGEAGVVVRAGGSVVAVIALDVRDGRVEHIHAVGNPAKLPVDPAPEPG